MCGLSLLISVERINNMLLWTNIFILKIMFARFPYRKMQVCGGMETKALLLEVDSLPQIFICSTENTDLTNTEQGSAERISFPSTSIVLV